MKRFLPILALALVACNDAPLVAPEAHPVASAQIATDFDAGMITLGDATNVAAVDWSPLGRAGYSIAITLDASLDPYALAYVVTISPSYQGGDPLRAHTSIVSGDVVVEALTPDGARADLSNVRITFKAL